MDSEINFERLQKKHTKTLIGSTVRNESPAGVRDDEEAAPEGKADSGMSDENQSADLKDQEDELDRLLSQGVADLASEAEAMKAKMRKHSEELKTANSRRRGSDIETIREDDQERVAPAASYPDTAFAHEPRSVKTGGDDGVAAPAKVEYFKPHEMPTPKEIVEEVNAGSYTSPEREDKTTTSSNESQGKKQAQLEEKAAEEDEEERKLDKEIAKKLHMNVTKLGVDVPDSTIENDSIYIPPAAMSDGSSSRLLREQERSLSRDHHKNDTALKRPALPHLASGESYHGGIYNKDYYKEGFPLTDTPEDSEPVERKPRHEPGTVKNLNASSLNYLRSLSTSRARADNDRRAMGVDVNDQEDLKQTGGLIGDGNMTQIADLEEAMDSILSEVSSIAKPSDEHNLAAVATLPLSAESLEKKKETDGKLNEIDEKNVEGSTEETAEKNVENTEKTAAKTVENTEKTAAKIMENTTNTADISSETSQKQVAQEKDIDEDTQKKESNERSEAKKEPEVTQGKPENVSESDTTKKQNIKEPDSDHLGEQASKEKTDTSLNADLKEDMEGHSNWESGEKATSEKRNSVPVGSGEDSAELVVDAEFSVKKSEKSEQVEDDVETKASKESVVDDSAVKEEEERKDELKEQQKSKESSEEQASAKDDSDDSSSSKNHKQISDDSGLSTEDKETAQKDDIKKTDVALNDQGADAEKKTSVVNTNVKDEKSEDVADAESSKEASKADKASESKSKSDDEATEGSEVAEAKTDESKVIAEDDKKAENVKSSNSEVQKDDIKDANGQEEITETNKVESSGDSANAKTEDAKEESSTEKEDIEKNDIAKNDAEKEDLKEKNIKTDTENQEDEKKETDSETGDKDLEENKVAETEDDAEIKGDAKTKVEEVTVIASSEPAKKEKIEETEEKTEETGKIEETEKNAENAGNAEKTEKAGETEKTEEKAEETGETSKDESSKDESSNDDIEKLIAEVEREQRALESKSHQTGSKGGVRVAKEQKMTFEDEPVYLYTSFAGGMQVASRTRRMETILAANKIKFQYKDMGTDPQAKRIWRTFSQGKALPGIVRGKDDFIGNWEDIEEANEDYAVRQLIYETY